MKVQFDGRFRCLYKGDPKPGKPVYLTLETVGDRYPTKINFAFPAQLVGNLNQGDYCDIEGVARYSVFVPRDGGRSNHTFNIDSASVNVLTMQFSPKVNKK